MKETSKSISSLVTFCLLVWLAILLASLPLALIGWGIVALVGIFASIGEPTYWNCVGIGLGLIIVINIVQALK